MMRIFPVFLCLAVSVWLGLSFDAAASTAVPVVTTASFSEKVLQSSLPVVVQFDARWCPYCRKVQPVLGDLARDRAGKVAVYRIDIDADPGLAQLFNVKSLPTIVLIKNGMEAGRMEGVPSKAKLYLFAAK